MTRLSVLALGSMLTACAGERSFEVTRIFPLSADVVYETAMDRFGDAHRIHPHLFDSRYLDGAEAPSVGVRREVWMSEDGEEVLREELLVVDPDERHTKIAIVEADNVPIDTTVSVVESRVTPIDDQTSSWTTTFQYRLKPAFLAAFAEGGMRSDMEDMLIGLEHHIRTGEDITLERFEQIEADYR